MRPPPTPRLPPPPANKRKTKPKTLAPPAADPKTTRSTSDPDEVRENLPSRPQQQVSIPMETEEDAALLLDPVVDPSNPPPLSQTGKTLRASDRFRKVHSQLARVQSHLKFANECLTHNVTPKGLKVNVSCQAMLRDYTNVAVRFQQTLQKAEHDYSNHLLSHYKGTRDQLLVQLAQVEEAIEQALETATPDEKTEHDDLIKSSLENVEKEMERLKENKLKKLDLLKKPPPKGKGGASIRGKGRGKGKGKGKAGQGSRPNPPKQPPRLHKEDLETIMQFLEQRESGRQPPSGADSRQASDRCQPSATGRGPAQGEGFH